MARIEQGFYTVELVPEGTIQRRLIHDDGNYDVIQETPYGNVFEGGFGYDSFGTLSYDCIFSLEHVALHPDVRGVCTPQHFKIIKKN